MHNFVYVTKGEAAPVKEKLLDIIHQVQNLVRDKFTFRYDFIGSSSRNMITRDLKSNIGYDFDVNIQVNDEDEEYDAKQIKQILMNAFNKVIIRYGYKHCEDSTRVFTIKFVDSPNSRIIHSCDFAVVYNCSDGRQQYIRFNKSSNSYSWEYQPNDFVGLGQKIEWLKKHNCWNDVKDYYIEKKNMNNNPDKHSRSVFAETINEIYQKC